MVEVIDPVWCNIVTRNSVLTIGLAYRSPSINKEDNTAIKEVSKVECTIMAYLTMDTYHDNL